MATDKLSVAQRGGFEVNFRDETAREIFIELACSKFSEFGDSPMDEMATYSVSAANALAKAIDRESDKDGR